MYIVFYSLLTDQYCVVSSNNAEIVGFEFNKNYKQAFEGTRKQCNDYVEELTDEPVLIE